MQGSLHHSAAKPVTQTPLLPVYITGLWPLLISTCSTLWKKTDAVIIFLTHHITSWHSSILCSSFYPSVTSTFLPIKLKFCVFFPGGWRYLCPFSISCCEPSHGESSGHRPHTGSEFTAEREGSGVLNNSAKGGRFLHCSNGKVSLFVCVHSCSTDTACICFSTNIPAFSTVLTWVNSPYLTNTSSWSSYSQASLLFSNQSALSSQTQSVWELDLYTEHILFYNQTKF